MAAASNAPFGGAPAFCIIYGASKYGKTTDCLFSFPNAFYISLPKALAPSENVVGFTIPTARVREVNRISEATELLTKLPKDIGEVVIDDFTFLAEKTMAVLERKHSGFKLWGALRDEVIDLRDAARTCNRHVIMNSHESAPTQKQGAFIRGGPRLPGRLPEDVPAACDLVLRASIDTGRKGWPGCYRCTPNDPNYISGDRHGVTPDMAPMNIGEILRSAGYAIRRVPSLDWMEPIVEKIAVSLIVKPPETEQETLTNAVAFMRANKVPELHIRWAVRDGIDRAILRRAKANPLAAYGL